MMHGQANIKFEFINVCVHLCFVRLNFR